MPVGFSVVEPPEPTVNEAPLLTLMVAVPAEASPITRLALGLSVTAELASEMLIAALLAYDAAARFKLPTCSVAPLSTKTLTLALSPVMAKSIPPEKVPEAPLLRVALDLIPFQELCNAAFDTTADPA